MKGYGTKVVAGVTLEEGRRSIRIPVFNTVEEAVRAKGSIEPA